MATYPTWAYSQIDATAAPVLAADATALAALGSNYTTAPYAGSSSSIAPYDAGLVNSDIRLQQLLVEARISNALFAQANPGGDDPVVLRADILATDISVSS